MMFSRLLISFLISLCLCFNSFGAEYIESFEEKNISVLNDELRDINRRLQDTEASALVDLTSGVTGVLPTANGGTGQDFSAAAAGGIFYLSNTGVISVLSKASDNDQLKLASGIPAWFTPSVSSPDAGNELFTADGNFTVPAGVTTIYLTQVAQGGGGGGVSSGFAGGGSGGEWIVNFPVTTTPTDVLAVQVGSAAGGGGVADVDGTAGEDTIFDTGGDAITCKGGNGGIRSGGGGTGGAAVGGSDAGTAPAAGGFTQLSGAGGDGVSTSAGGGGGGTPFGIGGVGGNVGQGTAAASNTGAGGGGAARSGTTSNGGAGGSGFVWVQW